MSHFIIQLSNLRFYAPHGVFAEETMVGNSFEINLSITVAAPPTVVKFLDETVNYAEVHQIVKNVFSVPQQLLETLTMEMAENIKGAFPQVQKIVVQITKLHPPIVAFNGSVSVTFEKDYSA